jgi:hypothetical protein
MMRLGRIADATDAFSRVLSVIAAVVQSKGADDSDKETQDAKEHARGAMKKLVLARILKDRIESQVNDCDYKNVLKTSEELLLICPLMHEANTHKARALCQLHRFEECKELIEKHMTGLHFTTRQATAKPHKSAGTDIPTILSLQWSEVSPGVIDVDTQSVGRFMLCIGPELSQIYLMSLKNISLSRGNCCADVMAHISKILEVVNCSVMSMDVSFCVGEWAWVCDEIERISALITGKADADNKFLQKCYVNARDGYSSLLQVCT